ncbi:EF-hand domain-containing protein [Methylibium petroleiphilum]|uniref:EF-hand domain-containing protein n=1 Tax=Methylibium petroleiphilum (strain ATCC BAA-1232 / LMG 22953 / PM1) TaxID=420662 RepID=A2SIC6_METPP|nr:EF-hand domain-containing protein [Methylibium petroleiphilum]ABM95315.1 hypothetical protein Mpe_A2360 [Methylibium petroleiphilum PM1]
MGKLTSKPISLALGATYVLAGMNTYAGGFQMTDLPAGYMLAAAQGTQATQPAQATDRRRYEGHCGGVHGEGMCGARAFDMMEGNKDGSLTRDEYVNWHDKNWSDGSCGACMGMPAGRGHDDMCGPQGYDMMDTDKNGKLTKDEFVSWHDKNWSDGMCGAYMKMPHGRCGEGMCGGTDEIWGAGVMHA